MDDEYSIVTKYRFTQFSHILGFSTRLHVYCKEAVQKQPELVIKNGSCNFSALAHIFPNGIRPKYNTITALNSLGCHNDLPQTQWPKTLELYPLHFWRPELEMKVLAAPSSLRRRWGENPSSGHWWLLAFLGCLCLQLHRFFLVVANCASPFFFIRALLVIVQGLP